MTPIALPRLLARSLPHLLAGAALLACAALAQAQIFKWTDAKGVVHYSDTPPQDESKAELRDFSSTALSTELPYGLAQAARANPVVLYTTAECNACDQGRALLQGRGIPFAEKTVTSGDDQEQLRVAGGDGQVPFLLVGRTRLVGYDGAAWNAALTDASYPSQGLLPPGYMRPAAEPAAPRVAAQAAAAAAAPERPPAPPKREKPKKTPPPTSPPDFQF